MRDDLVEAALKAHNADPKSILKGGDGTAAVVLRFKTDNPDATVFEIADAVRRFKGGGQ